MDGALESPMSTLSASEQAVTCNSSYMRYIPLDRIALRPRPSVPKGKVDSPFRPQSPDVGVTSLENVRCPSYGNPISTRVTLGGPPQGSSIFTLTAGSRTLYLAAATYQEARQWVDHIRAAWLQCFECPSRGVHLELGDGQQQALRLAAENGMLRQSMTTLQKQMQEEEGKYFRMWLEESKNVQELENHIRNTAAVYEVVVFTGSMRGAGTDARVFIKLVGIAQDLAGSEVPLVDHDSREKPFRRGRGDRFLVRCTDVGLPVELHVWHDNSGKSPGWFLDQVDVRKQGHTEWVHFPCHHWLHTDKDDGRIYRVLFPRVPYSTIRYQVITSTSDLRGSGTDANVYLLLHGSLGDSHRQYLSNGQENFCRGQEDQFIFEDCNIGDVEAITIGHDGTGAHPAWHLDHVRVHVGDPPAPPLQFACRCWLDSALGPERVKRNADNSVEMRVAANRVSLKTCQYTMWFHTSDLKGAGTDADVYMELVGPECSTGKVNLSSLPGQFARGNVDEIRLQLPDIGGEPQRLTLGHNNRGADPAWHLDMVVCQREGSQRQRFFFWGKWLSADPQGDPCAPVECTIEGQDVDPRRQRTKYQVSFYTSSTRGAGTDANVFFSLHGERGSSGTQAVAAKQGQLERGGTDEFCYELPWLGKLDRMVVWHDSSGQRPAWHLDRVVVSSLGAGVAQTATFHCRQWIRAVAPSNKEAKVVLTTNTPPSSICQYTIKVVTADERGAGTDAKISVELIDIQDNLVGPLLLEDPGGTFDRNKEDVFVFDALELGPLSHVQVTSDGSGQRSDWKMAKMEVLVTTRGAGGAQPARYLFTNNEWFNAEQGLVKVFRPVLEVDDGASSLVTYEVHTFTSDRKGAGTDANITINILGTGGETGESLLVARHNSFERGKEDVFNMSLADVGTVARLVVKSDCGGHLPAWHLHKVLLVVKPVGTPPRCFYFPAQCWLNASHCEVELIAQPQDPDSLLSSYEMTVYTSDKKNAGTDGQVEVELIDAASGFRSGLLPLSTPVHEKVPGAFLDRGTQDVFVVKCIDFRALTGIRVCLTGGRTPWHLDTVKVVSSSGQQWFFPYNDWIQPTRGSLSSGCSSACSGVIIPVAAQDPFSTRRNYKVTTWTTDTRGAGTDATVTIELLGQRDGSRVSSGRVDLRNRNLRMFDRGQVDEFDLTCNHLGELTRIVIGHDGSGPAPAWHLQKVKVTDVQAGKSWYFDCDDWLDDHLGRTGREKVLQAATQDPASRNTTYEVVVHTSNIKGAGTSAQVFITLFGIGGATSGKRWLESPVGGNGKEAFTRGAVDRFFLHCKDLDVITKIHVGHDNTGDHPAWHLSGVEVVNSQSGQRWWFYCQQELSGKTMENMDQQSSPNDVLVELKPGAMQSGTTAMVVYEVTLFTSDIKGAGTDGRVELHLKGTKGSLGPLFLENAANNFERGRVDKFRLSSSTGLGALIEAQVTLTPSQCSGTEGCSWHLDMIHVRCDVSPTTWYFPCDEWISDLHGLTRKLTATETDPRTRLVTYQVTTCTSNVRNAGTDAKVFISLVGSSGQRTPPYELKPSSPEAFDRGKTDVFDLRLAYLGSLSRLHLYHDNSGPSPNWHLDHVQVRCMADSKSYYFPCGRWVVSDGDGGLDLAVGTPASRVSPVQYEVRTITSNMRDAGTDASVYIQLKGDKGMTEKLLLCNAGRNDFQRGQEDVFSVEGPPVGQVLEVWVGHDDKGRSPGWHLRQLTLVESSTNQTLEMAVNKWFDRQRDDGAIERQVYPVPPGTNLEDEEGTEEWQLTMYTGPQQVANPLGHLHVEVCGSAATFGPSSLSASGPSTFPPDSEKTFNFLSVPLGSIQQLILTLKRESDGSVVWHLVEVQLVNLTTGVRYYFPVPCPLDTSQSPSYLLYPRPDPRSHPHTQGQSNSCKYTIAMTSSLASGNNLQDVQIYYNLMGDTGETGEQQFHCDNIPAGSCREVAASHQDVGNLEMIRLRHTSTGGWHVQSIRVKNHTSGQETEFWVDGLIHPSPHVESLFPSAPSCSYKVAVQTGSEPHAGTTASILLQLFGQQCQWEEPLALDPEYLDEHQPQGVPPLQRGQLNIFRVKGAPDVGPMEELHVMSDGSGSHPTWYLEWIRVTNESSGQYAIFPCYGWLRSGPSEVVQLTATQDEAALSPAGRRKDSPVSSPTSGNITGYKITFHTSNILCGGTSQRVYFEIIGERGSTGLIQLPGRPYTFSRGGQATFPFPRLPSLGELYQLRVGLEDSSMFGRWHLRLVEVVHMPTNRRWSFPCHDWISSRCNWQKVLSGKAVQW